MGNDKVFSRVFGQSIISRYKNGPLGRGWSHNWDIQIQQLPNGDVVLHGPAGIDRLFTRLPNGTFTPQPGDFATLELTGGSYRLTEKDRTVLEFQPDLKLSYVQDSNGNRITLNYSGGFLTNLNHSSGAQLLISYAGNGLISRLVNPLGPGAEDDRITTFVYDGEHLITVSAPGNRITHYEYETSPALTLQHAMRSVTHPDNTEDHFSYDAKGRLIEAAKGCCTGSESVTYSYDSAGTVTITDATGRQSSLKYGLTGTAAQAIDGEGRILNFRFDTNALLNGLIGPGGERYRYAYDASGNLSSIEDPLRHVNAFTYDPILNRLTRFTDARQNGMQYAYDDRSNLTSITYADDSHENIGYDSAGNLITSTNRRGQAIVYTRNAAGQLTSKDYADTPGVDFTYIYDSAGNLITASGPEGVTAMTYDPQTGLLTRIEYPGDKWFTFAYDAVGRRTHRTDQDGNLTAYLYDSIGRLKRMTNGSGGLIVQYEYDPAGRLSRKALGNGVFTTYDYSPSGRVLQLVNHKPDGAVLSHFDYSYDNSGRRVSMTTSEGTYNYAYNAVGEITGVAFPDGNVVRYEYDSAGNRTQVIDNEVATVYGANKLNQYTVVGASTYSYDADGSLVSKIDPGERLTYLYDPENRLIAVETPTDLYAYNYDALGHRISSVHNGVYTRYIVDPTGLGNVAAEVAESGNLLARYDYGFTLVDQIDAHNKPNWYTFTATGNTSEITDASGDVLNSYVFDPFGKPLLKQVTIPNPFEFVGELGVRHEFDDIEFMRRRFYDSRDGRFLSPDPVGLLGGDGNVYRYVQNAPTGADGVDPTGLYSFGGTVLGAAVHAGWNPTTGETFFAIGVAAPVPYPTVYSWNNGPDDFGGSIGIPGVIDFDFSSDFPEFDESFPFDAYLSATVAPFTWSKMYRQLDYETKKGVGLGVGIEIGSVWRLPFRVFGPVVPTAHTQHSLSRTIRPVDPNDKVGPQGYASSGFVQQNAGLAYQILFENKPSASAPAKQIIVTDALDSNLDLNSLLITEITFANHMITIPPGLNHYEFTLALSVTGNQVIAHIQAALDMATRKLTLTIRAVDPATGWFPEDPLVGILYPEDGTGVGEGSISYIVSPLPNVPTGTEIRNRASIVFDFNDSIETPTVLNTIDAGRPTSAVVAQPQTSTTSSFTVQWSGQDDPSGSGIADFDIYASTDGINYFTWQKQTTATSATFTGAPGGTYYFYSIARDNVDLEELPPSQPDAQTTVFGALNAAPIAIADGYALDEDVSLSMSVPGVLANDSDSNNDHLSAVLISAPTHGVVTLHMNGSFSYMPEANYFGPDSFVYVANDGTLESANARVDLTINAVNDPPSFLKGPDQIVPQGGGLQAIPAWATALSVGPLNEAGQTLQFFTGSDASYLFAAGPAVNSAGTLTYTPAEGQRGTAHVTVQLRDSGGTAFGGQDTSAVQTFAITIGMSTDSDGDALPDDFELASGLDPANPNDSGSDWDGDGFTGLEEFRAGTNPLDSRSSLRITASTSNNSGTIIEFNSVAGKNYSIEHNDDFPNGLWLPLVTVMGTGNPVAQLDPGSLLLSRRIYRLSTIGPDGAVVTSELAGFCRLPLLGNSDSALSIPFTRPSEDFGAAVSASGPVIQLRGTAAWMPNQWVYAAGIQSNTYYVLIRSGAQEGDVFTILRNEADTLTLDLEGRSLAGLNAGDAVAIVPYWTLGTIFPSGAGIHLSATPGNRGTELLMPNVSGVGVNLSAMRTYYFWDSAWHQVGAGLAVKNDDVILPDMFLWVRHNITVGTEVITQGSVPASNWRFVLRRNAGSKQDNFFALPRPLPVSLNGSSLFESGAFRASNTPGTRIDELLVFNNGALGRNKSAAAAYYWNGAWRRVGSGLLDVGADVVFTPGTGFIIRSGPGPSPAIWVNAPTY